MKWLKLLFAFLLIALVHYAGSWFTDQGLEKWYPTLIKAPWTPPSIVFAIVWPILYVTIIISLWLILIQPNSKKRALTAFFIHLGFHFAWPICFFYLQSPLMGLICLIFLVTTLVWVMKEFYKLSKAACYILIPYLIWLFLALSMNGYIWYFN